ncbi:methyltransferase domain-containing protein [Aestuariispira insulae]|uniref:Methyltransferase family protein n=1 Tax=Aestuariispira insulae TaxID=1461337 RepID=A0A3D9HR58_9PROT|nr:methyltransferase domain-containing protein [Aestuariispira insulae]RED51997.1 methyltransferase family protein [Aestuariispira insulae]
MTGQEFDIPARMYDAHVLVHEGKLSEADRAYQAILQQVPDDPRVNVAYAVFLQKTNKSEQAVDYYLTAAKASPSPLILNALGELLCQLGRPEEAMQSHRAALSLITTPTDPAYGESHFLLAIAARDMPDHATAIQSFSVALAHPASSPKARSEVNRYLADFRPDRYIEPLERLAMQVIQTGEINPVPLRPNVQALLAAKPTLQTILNRVDFTADDFKLLAGEMLLLFFLRECPMTDPGLESQLISLRSALARHLLADPENFEAAQPVAIALAQQCLLTEYAYQEQTDDHALVDQIEHLIEEATSDALGPMTGLVCCLACFRPLFGHPLQDKILTLGKEAKGPLFAALMERHLEHPLAEAEIARNIPTFGTIQAGVSEQVRAQYEESPYPRWNLVGRGTAGNFSDLLHAQLPYHDLPAEAELLETPRMLLAGCGTGRQCVLAADALAQADITALDLSRRSLSYAIRKCHNAGLENIEFMQADILSLKDWDRRFDIIESTGVLHHLADPMAGWRILTDLLETGGFMKIGLYSRSARSAIRDARNQIKQKGYTATLDDIRAYRAEILALPENAPEREILKSSDFYTLSACRDLVFHVQEHQFTIAEIQSALQMLGLRFLGFQFPSRWQRQRFLDQNHDPALLRDLERWADFEEAYPNAFGSMYVFWCLKI